MGHPVRGGGPRRLTGPLAPAACGQYLQTMLTKVAWRTMRGVKGEPGAMAATRLGSRDAHSSLHLMVSDMTWKDEEPATEPAKSFMMAVQSPIAAAWMSLGNEAEPCAEAR